MSIPSVYINLEDDVSKIVTRLKHHSASQVVLVCPKRCYLFNDSINLRLLKKQTDLLKKEIFILTMDEKGQIYAKEAGFGLKFLPKTHGSRALSDVRMPAKEKIAEPKKNESFLSAGPLASTVAEIRHIAKKFAPEKIAAELSLPEEKKIKAANSPKVQVTDAFFPQEIEDSYRHPKTAKSSIPKIITGFAVLSVIIILLLAFVVLPKASVVVFARTEPVTRDMEISISPNITGVDPTKLTLPATKIDETVNLSDNFQSQGKKQVGNKATGSIKIYNFTKLPINLKAATTSLIVGNKTYVLVNDVFGVKPTVYKNAKTKEVDLSSLGEAVEVVAKDGGEDYNLPAGTRLEITNQVFGSKPQLLYAKTESEIYGGTTRYLSVITQDDIDAAKAQLQARALDEVKQKIKSSDLFLPNKAYNFEISQFVTDNPVGAQTPNFQATLQAKLSGLAYKQTDLTNLIFQRISQTLDTNKTLKSNDPNSTSVSAKNYDPNSLLAVLTVHFQGEAVFDLNLPNISSELVGKSQAQAYEILKSKAEIDKVEITLAPVWQKSFPWFASKIKVAVATETSVGQ